MAKHKGLLITKEELVALYCYKNLSDMKIAKIYGCAKTNILQYRRKYGINKLFKNEKWLNEQYNIQKKTVRQIAKEINCLEDTVSIHLRKFGFEIDHERARIVGKKYHFNERVFKRIDTPEKAYWLGFITADGCIEQMPRLRKSDGTLYFNYRLRFCLAKKDSNHLEKFKTFLGNKDLPITEHKTYLNKTGKTYPIVGMKVCCKKLALDLIELGVLPSKSTKEKPPTLQKDLIPHYIRGIFDGDGCLSKGKTLGVTIVGSKELMEWIKAANEKKGCIRQDSKSKDLFCYHLWSKNDIHDFLAWIYKDSTVSLIRKFKVFQKALDKNYFLDRRYSPISIGNNGDSGRNDLSPTL